MLGSGQIYLAPSVSKRAGRTTFTIEVSDRNSSLMAMAVKAGEESSVLG
jgi:hypothetical protein